MTPRPTRTATSPTFALRGGNAEAWDYRPAAGGELVVYRGAGTGKTVGSLLRMLDYSHRYPVARMLIIRKTRVNLTESALGDLGEPDLGAGYPVLGNPSSEVLGTDTSGRTARSSSPAAWKSPTKCFRPCTVWCMSRNAMNPTPPNGKPWRSYPGHGRRGLRMAFLDLGCFSQQESNFYRHHIRRAGNKV